GRGTQAGIKPRSNAEGATLFLLCAGSYANNLGMVLIGSNDPPHGGFSVCARSRAQVTPV
ncbi:hypothetical protein NKI95_24210, partial [Mesorhizobium sp. M0306]|uniref:hypothetical protein n=1 Tax=Mesorhizobium sp. M0306 TaxID=2956932 RepID=UPI00333D82BF